MRLRPAIIGILVVGLAAGGLTVVRKKFIQLHRRHMCRSNLLATVSFVTQYRYDEPNHYLYPPDIHAVYAIWSHFSPQALAVILACPGTGKSHVTLTNAADSGDYTYINWSRWYGTNAVPGDYPVLYDRLLSNHGGNGVNVAQVNNVTFWDPGAKWLKNFAETHPSYEIPIPK